MSDVDSASLFDDPSEEAAGQSPNENLTSPSPVPLEVRDVVLDPVFARRRDALLRTVPVHDIVVRAERSDSGVAGFDTRALVLAALDAVIARQGFPDRATSDQVLALLSKIAAVQDPNAGAEACVSVAGHVVDGLTNRRERERQFSISSIVYAQRPDGDVVSEVVPRRFWLLREAEDKLTGETYLECSADAVNALVSGLDLPIEDQQAALETILERQLARGELDAAHATAVQARRLTAGYLIKVEELLAETERYLPGTDWRVAGPKLINDALEHITECLTREGRLLDHVTGGIADRPPSEMTAERRSKISTAMAKLLSESRHLHTMLMERLIGARGRFLDAQDTQMFRPALAAVEFDLRADLLEPTLALHVTDVEAVAVAYVRASLGPRTPVVLNWGDFVEALIHAPRMTTAGSEDTDNDVLAFLPDPEPLVSRELLAAAHEVLARTPLPTRLSTLLAACPQDDGPGATLPDLFVAASLRGFDNSVRDGHPDDEKQADELATRAGYHDRINESDDETVLPVHLLEILGPDAACLDDGTTLTEPSWSGNDLIVCVDRDQADALLLGEITTPTVTSLGMWSERTRGS